MKILISLSDAIRSQRELAFFTNGIDNLISDMHSLVDDQPAPGRPLIFSKNADDYCASVPMSLLVPAPFWILERGKVQILDIPGPIIEARGVLDSCNLQVPLSDVRIPCRSIASIAI